MEKDAYASSSSCLRNARQNITIFTGPSSASDVLISSISHNSDTTNEAQFKRLQTMNGFVALVNCEDNKPQTAIPPVATINTLSSLSGDHTQAGPNANSASLKKIKMSPIVKK
jgi:hypothetical protein